MVRFRKYPRQANEFCYLKRSFLNFKALNSNIRLIFSLEKHEVESPPEIQQIFRRYKSGGFASKLNHFELFYVEFWNMLECFGDGKPMQAKNSLQKLSSGFDDGTFCPSNLPEDWRKLLKASAIYEIFPATADPSLAPLLKPFNDALDELLAAGTGLFPHLDKVRAFRDMQSALMAESKTGDKTAVFRSMVKEQRKYGLVAGPCDQWCASNFSDWFMVTENEEIMLSLAKDAISDAKNFYGSCSQFYIGTMMMWTEIFSINYSVCGFPMRPAPAVGELQAAASQILDAAKLIYFPDERGYLDHIYCYFMFCPDKVRGMEGDFVAALQLGVKAGHQNLFPFMYLLHRSIFYAFFVCGGAEKELLDVIQAIAMKPSFASEGHQFIANQLSICQYWGQNNDKGAQRLLDLIYPRISIATMQTPLDVLIAGLVFSELGYILFSQEDTRQKGVTMMKAVCKLVIDAFSSAAFPAFMGRLLINHLIVALGTLIQANKCVLAWKFVIECKDVIEAKQEPGLLPTLGNAVLVALPELQSMAEKEAKGKHMLGDSDDDGSKKKTPKRHKKRQSRVNPDESMNVWATAAIVVGATAVGLTAALLALRVLNRSKNNQ
jgi:hypothetical protein